MKIVHMWGKLATDGSGNVSALCYAQPRPIDLKKATWTNRREAVTCARCRKAMVGNNMALPAPREG